MPGTPGAAAPHAKLMFASTRVPVTVHVLGIEVMAASIRLKYSPYKPELGLMAVTTNVLVADESLMPVHVFAEGSGGTVVRVRPSVPAVRAGLLLTSRFLLSSTTTWQYGSQGL